MQLIEKKIIESDNPSHSTIITEVWSIPYFVTDCIKELVACRKKAAAVQLLRGYCKHSSGKTPGLKVCLDFVNHIEDDSNGKNHCR